MVPDVVEVAPDHRSVKVYEEAPVLPTVPTLVVMVAVDPVSLNSATGTSPFASGLART